MNLSEYKYKIETHAHTSPMSGCADFTPQEVIERYADIGFSAIAITNHFSKNSFLGDEKSVVIKRFLKDYYDSCDAGAKYGITVIFGMEIRFPNERNLNDYLVYGITEDDMDVLYDLQHTDCATFYKEFINEKRVIIQAHPFRGNCEMDDMKYLDGIETFNMHPKHNSKVALATQYAKKFPGIITTCGTDFHHEGHQGLGGILTKTLPKDSLELAAILRSHDYLFHVAGAVVIP